MKRRGCVLILIWMIVLLLGLEGLLRAFDPLGLHYFTDLEILGRGSVSDDARLYVLAPGRYALRGWQVNELPNGVRLTPDTVPSACTLLILGDSVAFGQGVNDDQTFANRLAQAVQVQVVNAAFEGYNSQQVLGALRHFPQANVVLYLVSNNDKDDAWRFDRPAPVSAMPALSLYVSALSPWGKRVQAGETGSQARFDSDLRQIASDRRVIIFAFPEPIGYEVHDHYGAHLIPWYTQHNSWIDGHPNAVGHAEIAAALLPIVHEAVQEHCTTVF